MYPRLLIGILFLLAACQSRKSETKATADSTALAGDSTAIANTDTTSSGELNIPMRERESEQIISFTEFYNKYIKTKTIGTLSLPILFADNTEGTGIYESPEGAFENIPKRNGQVQVLGLLPDTSRYYGIVYAFNLMVPITYEPSNYYSVRVATFSRDGKFIARAEIITNSNFDGASSCGKAENVQRGFIDKDLSFYGMHALIQNCEDEGKQRPAILNEMNYGQIAADGTIFLQKDQRDDSNDDNTPPFIGYALNEKATIGRLKVGALEGNDLLAFFPESDLRSKTEYWNWYALRYPVANHSLVATVRRMKTDDSGLRKRHYGVVVVTNDDMSKPYNFYFEDDLTVENNEPEIILLYDRMLMVTMFTPQEKSMAENVTVIPFLNGDFSIALNQLSKGELEYERNWILAHNGLKFDSPKLVEMFSKYDWYKPTVTNLPLDKLPYEDHRVINEIELLMK